MEGKTAGMCDRQRWESGPATTATEQPSACPLPRQHLSVHPSLHQPAFPPLIHPSALSSS